MRQVSLANAKDKLSEYAAAAAGGEEIMITRHGRPYAKLVAASDDDSERRRRGAEAARRLAALGERILRERGPTPLEDVVAMIHEDRR